MGKYEDFDSGSCSSQGQNAALDLLHAVRNDKGLEAALCLSEPLLDCTERFLDRDLEGLRFLRVIADINNGFFTIKPKHRALKAGPRTRPLLNAVKKALPRDETGYKTHRLENPLLISVAHQVLDVSITILANEKSVRPLENLVRSLGPLIYEVGARLNFDDLSRRERRRFINRVAKKPGLTGLGDALRDVFKSFDQRVSSEKLLSHLEQMRDLVSELKPLSEVYGYPWIDPEDQWLIEDSIDAQADEAPENSASGFGRRGFFLRSFRTDYPGLYTKGQRSILGQAITNSVALAEREFDLSPEDETRFLVLALLAFSIHSCRDIGDVARSPIGSPEICDLSGRQRRVVSKRRGQFSAPSESSVPYQKTTTEFMITVHPLIFSFTKQLVRRNYGDRSIESILFVRGLTVDEAFGLVMDSIASEHCIRPFRRNSFRPQLPHHMAALGVHELDAYLACGAEEHKCPMAGHYVRRRVATIAALKRRVLAEFLLIENASSCTDAPEAYVGAESITVDYFRSRVQPIYRDLQQAFQEARKAPLESHNHYVCLLALVLNMLTGARQVDGPFCDLPITLGITAGILAPRDKHVSETHDARQVPLPDLALAIIEQYIAYLQALTGHMQVKKTPIGEYAREVLRAMGKSSETLHGAIFRITPTKSPSTLRSVHLTKTLSRYIQCERQECRRQWALFLSDDNARGVPPLSAFLWNAVMGHDMLFDPNFGRHSSITLSQYVEQVLPKLNEYPIAIGWISSNELKTRRTLTKRLTERVQAL